MKNSPFYEDKHDRADVVNSFTNVDITTLPHFHRCIEILYITDGSLRGQVEDESFSAEKDDIIFVRRCAIHSLSPADAYSNYVLVVQSAYADDFSSALEKETLPPLLSDKDFNRKLLPYFQKHPKQGNPHLQSR